VCAWGIPDHGRLQRVGCLRMPVFVANGDSDPTILPHYSYLLGGLMPRAQLKIYPDVAHGFHFQHHRRFAEDIDEFLSNDRQVPHCAQPGTLGLHFRDLLACRSNEFLVRVGVSVEPPTAGGGLGQQHPRPVG